MSLDDMMRTGAGGLRIYMLRLDALDQMEGLGCLDAPDLLAAGSMCAGPAPRAIIRGAVAFCPS